MVCDFLLAEGAKALGCRVAYEAQRGRERTPSPFLRCSYVYAKTPLPGLFVVWILVANYGLLVTSIDSKPPEL